ncbi:hypothetical protein [Nitrosomonas sp. Is37]|uniref:hypothetical protein n=1 Tax=Nitrosomonas sp. Is37 TaxID=3080535 RepID=UPI00294AAC5A|nr:hypothetical protein [Nitrosomonas sp. Is37]MDV6345344.1 hypothetical protein [Nitrosomonas sp. Is37]
MRNILLDSGVNNGGRCCIARLDPLVPKAENNKRALEAELYFYSRIFKFELAEEIEPVEIENL